MMKSIIVKLPDGTQIGGISLVKGGKNAGKYQALAYRSGNSRRNVATIEQAWKWLNKVAGGKAVPLTAGESMGYTDGRWAHEPSRHASIV